MPSEDRYADVEARKKKQQQQAYAKAGQPTPEKYKDGPKKGQNDKKAAPATKSAPSKPSYIDSVSDDGSEGSFGSAFAAARKQGLKEFEWRGKKYHTKTKEEMDGGADDADFGANEINGSKEVRKKGEPVRYAKGQAPAMQSGGQPITNITGNPSIDTGLAAIMSMLGIGGGAGIAYGMSKGSGADKIPQTMTDADLHGKPKDPLANWFDPALEALGIKDAPQVMTDADLNGKPMSAQDLELSGMGQQIDNAANRTMGPMAVPKDGRNAIKGFQAGTQTAPQTMQELMQMPRTPGLEDVLKMLGKVF